MDDYFYYIVGLTAHGLATLYLSSQYFSAKKLFDAFTKSMTKGINCLDGNEESTQYIVVRGKVKSIGPPIKSLNEPFTSGVIQKLTVKELCAEKTSSGIWINREEPHDEKNSAVPFQLENKKFKITVTSPLEAQFLDLEVVKPSRTFLRFLFGARNKGASHTEYMLKEKSILTGFGEVHDKNGMVQLIPPKNGMCYILTTMDPHALSNVLADKKKYYGTYCIIVSVIGIMIAGALTYKYWKARVRRKRFPKITEFEEQPRIEHRINANNLPPDIEFTCVVCYINPREIVILPCGHISLCADCAVRCPNNLCPVCMQRITSTHFIYIS